MTYYKIQLSNFEDYYLKNNFDIKTTTGYFTLKYKNKKDILYRSLIFKNANKLISFSPPKSIQLSDNFWDGDIYAEEFIDGTMINLFWDNKWNIATRSNVGGYNYIDNKTFRTMFLESMEDSCQLEELDIIGENGGRMVYSFVLQHINNRIVSKINKNKLYLVERYEIKHINKDLNQVYPVTKPFNYKKFGFFKPTIYSNNISRDNYKEMTDLYASYKTPYIIMGVVFKNKSTRMRVKYRNPNYEKVRELHGNYINSKYRYLELKRNNKVKDYLKYYPEKRDLYNNFDKKIKQIITQIHKYYLNIYVHHTLSINTCPGLYKKHLYEIHKLYLSTKIKTTRNRVKYYFNTLNSKQVLFILNRTKN